jgi:hypothetical protein
LTLCSIVRKFGTIEAMAKIPLPEKIRFPTNPIERTHS